MAGARFGVQFDWVVLGHGSTPMFSGFLEGNVVDVQVR